MHIIWRRSTLRRRPHNPAMLCGKTPTSARSFSRPQPHSVSCSISTGDGGTDRDTRGTTRLASTTDGRTAQRLARAGHRRYSGGELLSIADYRRNSLRLPAQHDGRSSSLELRQLEVHSSKLGRGKPPKLLDVHLCSLNFFWHNDEILQRLGYECFDPNP